MFAKTAEEVRSALAVQQPAEASLPELETLALLKPEQLLLRDGCRLGPFHVFDRPFSPFHIHLFITANYLPPANSRYCS